MTFVGISVVLSFLNQLEILLPLSSQPPATFNKSRVNNNLLEAYFGVCCLVSSSNVTSFICCKSPANSHSSASYVEGIVFCNIPVYDFTLVLKSSIVNSIALGCSLPSLNCIKLLTSILCGLG